MAFTRAMPPKNVSTGRSFSVTNRRSSDGLSSLQRLQSRFSPSSAFRRNVPELLRTPGTVADVISSSVMSGENTKYGLFCLTTERIEDTLTDGGHEHEAWKTFCPQFVFLFIMMELAEFGVPFCHFCHPRFPMWNHLLL